MRIPTRMTLALALGAALLGGCGLIPGQSGGGADDTAEAATAAYEAYTKAFLDGDGTKACSLVTEEYAEKILAVSVEAGFVEKDATCESLIVVLSGIADENDVGKSIPVVTVVEKPTKGAVLSDGDSAGGKNRLSMVLETDGWKFADDSGLDEDAGDEATPEAAQEETAEDVLRSWVAAYAAGEGDAACALQTRTYSDEQVAASVDAGRVRDGASCEENVAAEATTLRSSGIDLADWRIEQVTNSGTEASFKLVSGGSEVPTRLTFDLDGWRIATADE